MSWIVKLGKKGKKIVKKIITPAEKHYVGYTRRIERVKTGERICAMTFDDGPMGLPASPDSAARRGAASNSTTTPISTATTRAEPCTTTA